METGFTNIDQCDPRQCYSSQIMKTHRIITGIYRKHLKQFDLTNSQLSIMFILSKKGITTQTELSDMLYLEKSSVSRNMKRLFDKTYVSRANFPQLEITKQGLTILNDVVPFWKAAQSETNDILGEEGKNALGIILNQLTQ